MEESAAMSKYIRGMCCAAALATLIAVPCRGAEPPAKGAVMLDAMRAELDRSMRELKKQPVPPYYLAFEVTEDASTRVSAHSEPFPEALPIAGANSISTSG